MKTTLQRQSFTDYLINRWTGTRPRVGVVEFLNPLKFKPRSIAVLDTLALSKLQFSLDTGDLGSVMEYQYTVAERQYVFTDYNLVATPPDGNTVRVKLRIAPIPEARAAEGKDYDIFLLEHDYEQEYTTSLHDTLKKAVKNRIWTVTEDDKSVSYSRVNDAHQTHTAIVSTVTDRQGLWIPAGIKEIPIEYADFGREVDVPGGFKSNEFYFVEMVGRNHFFHMWKGGEINENRITVL